MAIDAKIFLWILFPFVTKRNITEEIHKLFFEVLYEIQSLELMLIFNRQLTAILSYKIPPYGRKKRKFDYINSMITNKGNVSNRIKEILDKNYDDFVKKNIDPKFQLGYIEDNNYKKYGILKSQFNKIESIRNKINEFKHFNAIEIHYSASNSIKKCLEKLLNEIKKVNKDIRERIRSIKIVELMVIYFRQECKAIENITSEFK